MPSSQYTNIFNSSRHMKIKDIVNRDIVNLTNCDQEPIHIPGSIQPHGFLVAFDEQYKTTFCSANVQQHLGITPAQLLHKELNEVFGTNAAAAISGHLQTLSAVVTEPLVITLHNQKFSAAIHKSNNTWVAEFESLENAEPRLNTVFSQTLQFVQYMQQAQTLQQLCARVAAEIRSLTGYDRVMVYRFDKDYNGEVYAESKRDDLEAFLGLHYPHTDIPVQARQLYIKNLLRIIVDVNYQPVPLYTVDDGSGNNLDLSLSALRSVSPIHIQYLQNMGVGATLTISLLHEGKLWGLIACHHYSAKYIDHYTRINALLQGHFLTSQIDVRQSAEEYALSNNVNLSLSSLLNDAFVPNRASLQAIISNPALLGLCNAAGVAIVLDDVIYKNGQTPADGEILGITAWAAKKYPHQVFSTSNLAAEYSGLTQCAVASGIIFCALSSLTEASITWFNPETREEVRWGGDPEKAIVKDENGLHPRKSFETWRQVARCQARDWHKPELTAAANYAYGLQKHITLLLLTEEGLRQKILAEKLAESNAELEHINWLSTHDLKEPLRKIQMFSSRLLVKEKDLSPDGNSTVQKMSASARRMQRLIEDLMQYARLNKSSQSFQMLDLNEILEDIQAELADEIAATHATVTIATNLPVINGVRVFVHELFVNLFRNSLKFTRPGVNPVIQVSCVDNAYPAPDQSKPFYEIIMADNGIGFENKYSEDIFKIFSRLAPTPDSSGSGVGLALCKKIMQIHNGYITAQGSLDNGASFFMYFPKS